MSVWDALKFIPQWYPRYFFTLAAVACLLLLASATPWAPHLGFGGAPTWARLALTVATVGCSAVGAMKVWTARAEARKRDADSRARGAALEQELLSLTPSEREVLGQFVARNRKTASFPGGHVLGSTAHALTLRGHLLCIEERQTAFLVERTYMIQELVFAILRRHPEALRRGIRARSSE